jgi:AcrR family transcriptional regulator
MPGNFIKEDLRIIKTRKALFSALSSLLTQYKFSKITVHDICAEGLVSRTAFYTHFKDKYYLLQKWLEATRSALLTELRSDRESARRSICSALRINVKIIENLISDADWEQWQLLLDFFALDAADLLKTNEAHGCEKLLSDFFAGGMLNLLYSQVSEHHDLADEETSKAIYRVYGIIKTLLTGGYKNDDQR